MEKGVCDKLLAVQMELKAPKNQYNSFGKYHYRSCEDILEAVKPLCQKHNLLLTLADAIVEIGGRVYVRATATVVDNDSVNSEGYVSVNAYAREDENKKGMDGAQVTGSTSSYARKYALNGLFLIDDNKDSDVTNNGKPVDPPATKKETAHLKALCTATGCSYERLLGFYKVNERSMTKSQYKRILGAVEARAKKEKANEAAQKPAD